MRTFVQQTLAFAVAISAVACGTPQRQAPRDPIGGTPTPQASLGHPHPQAAHDPIGPNDPTPQRPLTHPTPQTSTFGDEAPQRSLGQATPQQPMFPVDDSAEDTPAARAQASKLDDAQILAVTRVANEGEVEMAELARKNATASDVKQFAARVLSDHRAAITKERRLEDKTKLQVQDNVVSSQVKSESDAALVALRAQSGADFDRGYVDAQVRIHKNLLASIDQRLLPNASNPGVKSLVQDMRTSVASHLAKAEALQKKLDPTLAKAREDDRRDAAKAKNVKKAPTPKPTGGKDEADPGKPVVR